MLLVLRLKLLAGQEARPGSHGFPGLAPAFRHLERRASRSPDSAAAKFYFRGPDAGPGARQRGAGSLPV